MGEHRDQSDGDGLVQEAVAIMTREGDMCARKILRHFELHHETQKSTKKTNVWLRRKDCHPLSPSAGFHPLNGAIRKVHSTRDRQS